MKKVYLTVLIFLLTFSFAANASAIKSLTIAATKRTIENYNRFTKGKIAADIDTFVSKNGTRQVIDILLVLKALKVAGFPGITIVFKEVPNSARERAVVKAGKVVLGEQDHWKSNFDDSVYMTDPIIRDGEFEKGIYIYPRPSTYKLLYVNSIEELRNYSAVIPQTWTVDWKTLKAMKLSTLNSTATAISLFRMLKANRADFILLEFSVEADFSRTLDGITLIPVPGIKVGLKGSRHLMISKIHPKGKICFNAVQKGLKTLRSEGVIVRALTECGFLDKRVSTWKTIN